MSDQDPRVSRDRRTEMGPSRSGQDSIEDLHSQIAELKTVVERLQASQEELEADREELQAENQRLRREMTLSNLVDDLASSIEEAIEEDGSVTVPPPAQRLYDQLPASFPFPAFFREVERQDLEMAQARRYLVRYLADGLLVQSGAYLQKVEREG